MHLLYLDDSGSASNPKEDYFVLGGISVPEDSMRWLSHELDRIAEKYNSSDPSAVEFHASEIYKGEEAPWNNFRDRQDRINIILEVLSTLRRAHNDNVLFATAVHKASFPGIDPVQLAFEDLTSRFDMYLNRISTDDNRQRGLIILDNTSYDTKLQAMSRTFRKEGNRWGSWLRGICEVPLFVDSRAARIIQLADHIAYSVFRRYNAEDIKYFNQIECYFDADENNVIHGLNHAIRGRERCMCPACLSRRQAGTQTDE